jgi:hypothetical protein
MFNSTNDTIFLVDEDEISNRLGSLIAERASKLRSFFIRAGFDVETHSALHTNLASCGKSDIRYALCEVVDLERISTRELVELAAFPTSRSNYNTATNQAKENGEYQECAIRFLNTVNHLLSKFGIKDPSCSTYSYFVWIARSLIITLWREKLLLLPLSTNMDFNGSDFDRFVKFKSSQHRCLPPMYNASEDRVNKLTEEFTKIFFDLNNAQEFESQLFQYNLNNNKPLIDGKAKFLFCSKFYTVNDVNLEGFEPLTYLSSLMSELKAANITKRIIIKDLLHCDLPPSNFISQAADFKTFCVKHVDSLKSDTLSGRSKKISGNLKKVILSLEFSDNFNYEAIIRQQDEAGLFNFFISSPLSSVQKLIDSNSMKRNPDYSVWNEYKSKHFSIQKTTKTQQKAANQGWTIIFKYLAYVEAWIEMFPASEEGQGISFPTYLVELDRETFIVRSYENKQITPQIWPRTLEEFVLRLPEGHVTHVRSCILDTCDNYKYLQEHVGESSPLLAGEFTQHWHAKSNGQVIGKLQHSVKQIIKKEHLPIVLEVAYVLEQFGSYLQEQILLDKDHQDLGFAPALPGAKNPYKLIKLLNEENITNGFSPIIWTLDNDLKYKHYRLDQITSVIPNIFGMNHRSSIEIGGIHRVLPSLGMIRGFIFAIEQGVRHKHIRFLDARYFDQYVDELSSYQDIVDVCISTDKCTQKPWKEPCHLDIINMLRAERNFLRKRTDPTSQELIKYPSSSQYIDVLFRNAAGVEFNENAWSESWTNFLLIAQQVVNHITKEDSNPCNLVRVVPTSKESPVDAQVLLSELTPKSNYVKDAYAGTPNEVKNYKFDAPATRVRLQALVTPHGTRTSFVSHRILNTNLQALALIMNHKSIATTNYYGIIEAQELQNIMYQTRNELKYRSSRMFTKSNEGMLSSSSIAINSRVQEAFEANRTATLSEYGFVSIPLVLPEDHDDIAIKRSTGIELLQEAPSSMIAFTATHICPYNMHCPSEIIAENGGFKRCGVCRAKACHVDNLISINRKVNQLTIDSVLLAVKIKNLVNNPLTDKEKQRLEVQNYKDESEVVRMELIGWEASRHVVESRRQQLIKDKTSSNQSKFVVTAPTLLSNSITCEKKKQKFSEIFLDHLMTLDDMPSLNSKEIEPVVRKLSNSLLNLALTSDPSEIDFVMKTYLDASINPNHLLSPILSMLDAGIITKQQIYEVLDSTLQDNETLSIKNKMQKKITETLDHDNKKRIE